MIFAIIPAAGKSSRMGRPKLALPVGGKRVLELVVEALRLGGVDQVLVVLAPHAAELRSMAESAGANVLMLDEETPDMRATVVAGLTWLDQTFHPAPGDFWFLVPADHPSLSVVVVQKLLQGSRQAAGQSVFIPTYQGQRGHPVLIGWSHVQAVRTFSPGQGLNVYLRQQPLATREVPVDEADILFDLDTPEDYARLAARGMPTTSSQEVPPTHAGGATGADSA
jgi:molybdenum cofactor cytidylyltransferase